MLNHKFNSQLFDKQIVYTQEILLLYLLSLFLSVRDLFLKTKIITKSFGSKNDIILIGKEELNYIYQQPKLLLDRIREFKDVKEQKQVILNKSILWNTLLYKSIFYLQRVSY